MTRKKTENKKEDSAFNWETYLDTMEVSSSLKAGFVYYIKTNNINIQSENDLNKEFNKFKQMNAGV